MKTKLKPKICYLAGLLSKSGEVKNAIGITTSIEEIEHRFLDICLKELKIEPNKIIIEDNQRSRHIFFYNSRLRKELDKIIERETIIFKYRNEYSANYIAGMYDIAGHIQNGSLVINKLSPKDQMMFENLGLRTDSNKIRNISSIVTLISGFSIMLERIRRSGNERDPH